MIGNYSDVTVMHPCSEIHHFSFTATRISIQCVLLNIFLGSLSVITICGNLLVIISVIYFKQLHTPTNYLILSLAVADLLVGLVVFPLNMEFNINYCMYYSEVLVCKVLDRLNVILSTASILNLCCISIDRYYAVCQPLMYHSKISVNVAVIMILSSWSVSLLVAAGVANAFKNENCGEKCEVELLQANILGPVLSFFLPVIIMLCVYLKIFLVAQRQVRSIKATAKSGEAASKMERKATKTLAMVMGVFLLCWSPLFLCLCFQMLNNASVPLEVFETLNGLGLSNSMLNPFIYALFYGWFRSAFRMIISGKIFMGDFTNMNFN